jgi:hypothetical protein
MPQDEQGLLGLATSSCPVAASGLTAQQLLAHVHAFYQQPLGPALLRQALEAGLHQQALAAVWAALSGGGGGGAGVRGLLLGSMCSFEGLVRASREPRGNVYELRLAS